MRLLGAAEERLSAVGIVLEPFERELADGVLAAARIELPEPEVQRRSRTAPRSTTTRRGRSPGAWRRIRRR